MDSKIAALGLEPEIAAKVESVFKEILKDSYVPMSRFNEVNDAKKQLETTVADRDAQLSKLGETEGLTADLKKQIEQLQAKNVADKKAYDQSLKQMKTDKYVSDILVENGILDANYIPAVRAYLPNVDIDSDDSKTVFISKLGEVKTAKLPMMFKSEKKKPTEIEGFHPASANASATATPVKDDGSYESYLKSKGYLD